MVLKSAREKLERFKAKAHGMSVPELREHLKQQKARKKARKARLRQKEMGEREKFEAWKIEQKYKRKRKQVKEGKSSAVGLLKVLGGTPSKSEGPYDDPFNIFGGSKRKKRRRRKR